jgi:hypothetical protein
VRAAPGLRIVLKHSTIYVVSDTRGCVHDIGFRTVIQQHVEWSFTANTKLKPVLYRSPFSRSTDLYPP